MFDNTHMVNVSFFKYFGGVFFMQLKDDIEEWLDELDIEKASKDTIRAYKNNLTLFGRDINN